MYFSLGGSQCSCARTFFPAVFVIFSPSFPCSVLPRFLSLLKPQKKKKILQKIWSRQSNKSTWVMDGGARNLPSSSSRRCVVFEDSYVAYVLWKAIPVANPPTYLYSEAECQRKPVLEKGSPPFFWQWFAPVVEAPGGTKRVRIPSFWLQSEARASCDLGRVRRYKYPNL